MTKKNDHLIIITGSSGFVGSRLAPEFSHRKNVFGVDQKSGSFTSLVCSLSNFVTDDLPKHATLGIIHLAAARFDHGWDADAYHSCNVTETKNFLKALDRARVTSFVHVSSVAAIDGQFIPFSHDLSCDDAYRSTKFLQEQAVRGWAEDHGVPLHILYPSAIFDVSARTDTNVGKLQKIVRAMPILPRIKSKKTLTYLPDFCRFIERCVNREVPPGRYLTIEHPVLSVTEIMQSFSGGSKRVVKIPFIEQVLYLASVLLWLISLKGKFDVKLTPNRVVKLFSNTEYKDIDPSIDIIWYSKDKEDIHQVIEATLR
jgi:nucleoside-diphosphate-sugar epimerase